MVKVEISDQVRDFVRALSPEPRRRLRLALRDLADGKGDIRTLEGPLADYSRLRCGPFRVLFIRMAVPEGATRVRCIFAERRNIVYEVFSHLLQERLTRLDDGD